MRDYKILQTTVVLFRFSSSLDNICTNGRPGMSPDTTLVSFLIEVDGLEVRYS